PNIQGDPSHLAVLPVHFGFELLDETMLPDESPKSLPIVGVDVDLRKVYHRRQKLLWGLVSVHSRKGGVNTQETPLWSGLEDTFHGIFKYGTVLLFARFQFLPRLFQ